MSRPVVYLGPTLTAEEARQILDADYRGPVEQGDVHRALATDPPPAIGIIDGCWGSGPTVWHLEIRCALHRGVRVYGAASLGALRAAELTGFGMVGVGRVYEAFRSGELEDDDEVAIAHAGAEDGYRPGSAAMVDIRATVAAAVRDGEIDAGKADRIVKGAKARHFADRTWPYALPRVFLKAEDARRMLARMREDPAEPPTGLPPWEPTDFWFDAWERDTGQEAVDGQG
jgi:hypothetical protein